jgi:predicted transcriptional regulator
MITTELHARFCRNVKSRRVELGLTQAQLAQKMKVTQPVIAQIESGRFVPTLDTVATLGKVLKMHDPQDLLSQELPTSVGAR